MKLQCPKKCSNLQLNFGALIIQAETIPIVLILGIVRHALHGFQYCIWEWPFMICDKSIKWASIFTHRVFCQNIWNLGCPTVHANLNHGGSCNFKIKYSYMYFQQHVMENMCFPYLLLYLSICVSRHILCAVLNLPLYLLQLSISLFLHLFRIVSKLSLRWITNTSHFNLIEYVPWRVKKMQLWNPMWNCWKIL